MSSFRTSCPATKQVNLAATRLAGHRARTQEGPHDAKAHDEGASRESNPRCSRQDSNLHCLSTPGLSRVAKPFAYASVECVMRVRTPRVELGSDAYKTSWLDRSRVRGGPSASRTQRKLLIRKLGQPARHGPKCQRTDSNHQRTGFKPVASADWATLAIVGANGGIRTLTMQGLKLLPLPIGLRSR